MLCIIRYDHRRLVKAIHLLVLGVASLACFVVLLQLQAAWTFRDIVLGIMVAIAHGVADFYGVTITIPGWAGPGFPDAAKPRKFDVTVSETVFMFALLVLGPGGVLPVAIACAAVSAIECEIWNGGESVRNWMLNGYFNVTHRVIDYAVALSWIALLTAPGEVPFHTAFSAVGLVVLIVVMPLWHAGSFTLLVMVRSGRSWRSAANDMFARFRVWIGLMLYFTLFLYRCGGATQSRFWRLVRCFRAIQSRYRAFPTTLRRKNTVALSAFYPFIKHSVARWSQWFWWSVTVALSADI